MPNDKPETTPVFERHWIKTYGRFKQLIVRVFGKTVELPSGNRITWFRGRAYIWERRVHHCEVQHIQFANVEDPTQW